MRIAVTGSIAEDYLLTFPGKFADMILEDQIERLSLSFLADSMQHRRGGVGGNIAYGMGHLGAKPILVGAVGTDFDLDYRPFLEGHGVDTSGVLVSPDKGTARFLCTTDEAQSQIATFYPGAMEDCQDIDLHALKAQHGEIDAVVVAPNGPEGMARHTREAHEIGIPVIADPSQQLARLTGEEIKPLIEGADMLLCNDYERSLITKKTGWSDDELRDTVRVLITTHGEKGCTLHERGGTDIDVPAVMPAEGATLEPTGAGDAFRSGLLAGMTFGLPMVRCMQLGATVATLCLESIGPQDYVPAPSTLRPRMEQAYGAEVTAEIMAAIPLTIAGE